MRLLSAHAPRCGATLVECALILPLTFLIILGMVVAGAGIFRYQEVSHLARIGSRYASTHGGMYVAAKQPEKTGIAAINSSDDLRNYYLNGATPTEGGKLILLKPEFLQVDVKWSESARVNPPNYPIFHDPNDVTGQKTVQNTVTVTLTYNWIPELWLFPITLKSSSTMPMAY